MLFEDDSELPGINAASDRLVKRALALEGTCTGEHGVGVGKKKYLVKELGQSTVELMWTIKNAIDPLNIMNPGKVCLLYCTRVFLVLTLVHSSIPTLRNNRNNISIFVSNYNAWIYTSISSSPSSLSPPA